jgi:hypothetical protein
MIVPQPRGKTTTDFNFWCPPGDHDGMTKWSVAGRFGDVNPFRQAIPQSSPYGSTGHAAPGDAPPQQRKFPSSACLGPNSVNQLLG